MFAEKELPESNEPEGINLVDFDSEKLFSPEQEVRIKEILREEILSTK